MLKVIFYQTENKVEPVRKWLKEELDYEDRKIIGEDIKTVQEGFPIGMPLVKSLDKGLWEVRSKISGQRIARVIFCHVNNELVLLHGFIKKTQKTPLKEIKIAKDRFSKIINLSLINHKVI